MAKDPKPKSQAPVKLRLLAPVNQLVTGRIVSASPARANKLIGDEIAVKATKSEIGLAGGRIPHLPD